MPRPSPRDRRFHAADFYSAVTGGIGALRGPLHGGANEAAMDLIEQFANAG